MELLAGAGKSRIKKLWLAGGQEWQQLVTLDLFDTYKPDVVWDLLNRPLPFDDNTFDEVHFYDVLEHLGQQGDFVSFFEEWSEWWRILKPGGHFFGISPHWSSPWCWMDPGHRRAYGAEVLSFLDQTEYTRQIGETPMTDYRAIYKADFEPVRLHLHANRQFEYILKAVKPSRIA